VPANPGLDPQSPCLHLVPGIAPGPAEGGGRVDRARGHRLATRADGAPCGRTAVPALL